MNKITNNIFSLSSAEKRFILSFLQKVNKERFINNPFEEMWILCSETDYSIFESVIKQLFNRYVSIGEGMNEHWIRWFHSIRFLPEQRKIFFKFSPDVADALREFVQEVEISDEYIRRIRELSDRYAGMIYTLIYKGTEFPQILEMDKETLIKLLDVPLSCQEPKFLKNKILLPAMENLLNKRILAITLSIMKPEKKHRFILEYTYL